MTLGQGCIKMMLLPAELQSNVSLADFGALTVVTSPLIVVWYVVQYGLYRLNERLRG